MKKGFVAIGILSAAALFLSAVVYAQSGDRGRWGNWGYESRRDRQWDYSPESGRPWGPYGGYGMDPEGRWDRAPRMQPEPEARPRAREPGYDYGPYYPGYENHPFERERRKPLDEDRAKRMMESYLDYTENPNLKLGRIQEKNGFFEGEIVTKKEGALVDKVFIDKGSGQMRFENER